MAGPTRVHRARLSRPWHDAYVATKVQLEWDGLPVRARLAWACAVLVALAACELHGGGARAPDPEPTGEVEETPPVASGAIATADDGGPALVEDWNDAGIAWRSYADGVAEATRVRKPIMLIFFTTWCPHCKRYSHVFSNPAVVELAKSFVMIRVDKDRSKALSDTYAVDGTYVPRVFFSSADGKLDPTLQSASTKFHYFYDEDDAAPTRAAMEKALSRFMADASP